MKRYLNLLLLIIFVQVGTNLYVVPSNVLALETDPSFGEPFHKKNVTFIYGINGKRLVSDWPIQKVRKALEEEDTVKK